MKRLKLFFAYLLMAVLSIGQVWAATIPFSETFASSTGTNNNFGTSTTSDGNGTFTADNTGWTTANAYGANGAAKFGASKKVGSATTPSLTVTNGSSYTLSFKAAPWANESTTMTITVTGGTISNNASATTATMSTGQWNSYEYTIVASSTSLTVAFSASKNRFFLDDISITAASSGSGSQNPTISTNPVSAKYAVDATATALSVEASGTGTLHYQWKSNTTNSTEGATSVGTDAATFTPSTANAGTTYYFCEVTDDNGSATSSIAEVKVLEPLTTTDQIFTAATNANTTATDVAVTFNNWVVTAVKGNNAYVSDGTKGFVIYGSGHGFAAGNILSGTALCQVKLYNGYAQLSSLAKTTSGLSVGTGGTVTPIDIDDVADLNDYNGAYTGSVIRLIGECTTENSKFYILGVQLWNNLYTFTNPTAGKNYYCTGIYYYGGTTYGHEIMPRSTDDIEEIPEQGAPQAPVFTPASDTYNEATNVTITCETEEAVIYYTMTDDGSTPTTPDTDDDSQIYNGAINLNANGTYKFKAIAFKNDLTSTEVSATYTINLPLPSHTFQVTHNFSTGAGFEFPEGWEHNGSYAEREITYTDDKVNFENASHQTGTITDRPVTKDKAISLILTNSHKLISAVRFDYIQWGTKTQTLVMKYSTDGGETYSNFDPVVSSTSFALQVLSMPEGVNAIQVTGTDANQVGLTSIAFDLEDKPIVKKVVNITAPAAVEGNLVVKNGEDPISDGDEIEVGTTLKIFATPEDGYSLSAISVKDQDNADVSVNSDNEFVVPNKNVTVSATFEEIQNPATLKLNVQGTESTYPGSYNVGAEVTLPSTATACEGNVFVGWSEVQIATPGAKPATKYYDKGASYELKAATQTLYAVYAQGSNATWTLTHEDVNSLAEGSGYAAYNGTHEKDAITFVTSQVMPQSQTIQFQAQAGVLYNTIGMPADIVSIEVDGFDLSVYEGTAVIEELPEGEAIEKSGDLYPFSAGKRFFYMKKTTKGAGQATTITVNLQPEYSNYTTSCIVPVNVPEPEFDVDEGTYTSEQLVLIDNYDGQYIYVYTTDGSEPTADGNLDPVGNAQIYDENDGIEINASCTLKARAYDAEGNYSDVTSAAYVINLPLSTIPAIFAAATSTQTEVNITMGNWVVSGVGVGSENNLKTAYVTDGTNGFIIFTENHGFEVGDILSGTVTCDLKKYSGAAELIGIKSSTTGLIVTKGGTIPTATTAPADLAGVHTGSQISLSNWKYDGEFLTNGTTKIKPWATLFNFEDAFTENRYYNVSGIYVQFGSTKEIMPRSTTDIVELPTNAPTMAWHVSSTDDTEIAANAIYSINLGDAFAPVFVTNSDGTLTYTSSNTDVAEIDAANGTLTLKGVTGDSEIKCAVAADVDHNLAADELAFTLRVRDAVSNNVVILVSYDGKTYAMTNVKGSGDGTLAAIEVEYSAGKIWNLSTEDKTAITWNRTVDGEAITFQDASGKFLKGKAGAADLTLEAGENVWNWYADGGYYRNSNNNARTFFVNENNNGVKNFKHYATSNFDANKYSSKPEIVAAVFADGEPELAYEELRAGTTTNKYYTICLPKKVVAFKGGNFWSMNERGNGLAYLEEVTDSDLPLAAGTPYIFDVTTTMEVAYEGAATTKALSNGALHGTFAPMDQTALNAAATAAGSDIYLLSGNQLWNVTTTGASGNSLAAGRAYIVYDELTDVSEAPHAPGKRVRAVPMQGQTATGMENVQGDNVQCTKVLINGQMYILRGEKLYDATGRLVK